MSLHPRSFTPKLDLTLAAACLPSAERVRFVNWCVLGTGNVNGAQHRGPSEKTSVWAAEVSRHLRICIF